MGEAFMKYKIAFVCTGNSCRSQMAEGWARKLGKEFLETYSAGTHPVKEVNRNAIAVMNEVGVSLNSHYPKLLEEIPNEIDILITMGCGVACPYIPYKYKEDWGLEDPVGKPMEEFREVRDVIQTKVKELIHKIQNNEIQFITISQQDEK